MRRFRPDYPRIDYGGRQLPSWFHFQCTEQASAELGDRPCVLYHSGDKSARSAAKAFADSSLLTCALCRRFGTLDFAQAVGWLSRTDYAAMTALLSARAVDAAVQVWKRGRHAVGTLTSAQRAVRGVELRAWAQGASRILSTGVDS